MKTLSDQLTELYESKWDGLMAQLEANGLKDQLQCPFLISLYRLIPIGIQKKNFRA